MVTAKAKRTVKRTSPDQIIKVGELMTSGLNSTQIGEKLGMSPGAAHYYMAKIKKVSGVSVGSLRAKAKNEREQAIDSLTREIRFLKSENDFLKTYIKNEIKQ